MYIVIELTYNSEIFSDNLVTRHQQRFWSLLKNTRGCSGFDISCGDDHEEEEDEASQPLQVKTSNDIRSSAEETS